MSRSVDISVYCDNVDGEVEVFGVFEEHRPDLPKPCDSPLQEWVREQFIGLSVGDSVERVAEMEYIPNGEIVEFREKQ